MEDQNNPNSIQMYMLEYQEISNNMRSFWKTRLTVLGFVITLIGILIKQFPSNHWVKTIILETTLLLIICGTTFILISLTKHLIIYGIRLREIEERLIHDGFWKKWGILMKNKSGYSNTRAISITIQILNSVILVYIIWKNLDPINDLHTGGIVATGLLFIFGVMNAFFIHTRLNPKNHWEAVKLDWKSTSEEVDTYNT